MLQFVLGLFLLIGWAGGAQADVEAPGYFFYKVQAPSGKISHVFGSTHLGNLSLYPLPAVVLQAYEQSEQLVLEARSDPEWLLKRGRAGWSQELNRGTLNGAFTNQQRQLLLQAYPKQGPRLLMLPPLRAYLALVAASQSIPQLSGQFMPEAYFIMQAGREKPILELESQREQMAMMSKIMGRYAPRLVSSFLKDRHNKVNYLQRLYSDWQKGDDQLCRRKLDRELVDFSPRDRHEFMRLMFHNRNQNWAQKLHSDLNQRSSFMVVGVCHLVGQGSFLEVLSQRGFKVSRLTTRPVVSFKRRPLPTNYESRRLPLHTLPSQEL